MASTTDDKPDARVGTVIADRYRITAKLGEGGMGAVYRGVHESLRKPVALKFMVPSARSDAELAKRFEREAVATANLKHPNISETTDYGQLPDGTLYLVMECIDGKNLRELVAAGRLPPARALAIVKQIGAALSFAHESDVVHRDLKPDNVIVFDRGSTSDLVKVIDFGIARMNSAFTGGKTALTQAGTVFGTPDYMAPEQAMGQAVDPRADQYALGAIAFELFTGKPPYAADNAASLMYMHVGAPIPRVSDLAPDLPPQISDVVAKMMAKLPDERFVSVDEALAALGRAFEAPPLSTPMSAPMTTPMSSGPMTTPMSSAPKTVPNAPPTLVSGAAPAPVYAPRTLVSPAAPFVAPAASPSSKSSMMTVVAIAIGGFLALAVAAGLYVWLAPHFQNRASTSSDLDAGDVSTDDTSATTVATSTNAETKPTTATTTTSKASGAKPATTATAKPVAAAVTTTTASTAPPPTPTNAPPSTPAATTTTPATSAPHTPPPPATTDPAKIHGHGHH